MSAKSALASKFSSNSGTGLESCRCPGLKHKAQRIAQCVADSVDIGVPTSARDADSLGARFLLGSRRGLMRPAAGRVDHDLFQVGLLYALKKSLEMPLFAPVGIALVHHVAFAKSLGKVSPRRARAGHPKQCIEEGSFRPSGAAPARRQQWIHARPLLVGVGVACVTHSGEIRRLQHGIVWKRGRTKQSKKYIRLKNFPLAFVRQTCRTPPKGMRFSIDVILVCSAIAFNLEPQGPGVMLCNW